MTADDKRFLSDLDDPFWDDFRAGKAADDEDGQRTIRQRIRDAAVRTYINEEGRKAAAVLRAQLDGTAPPDLDDVPTDATTWLSVAEEDPDWLVERLVEVGWNVLLAGPKKVGKTSLVVDLVRCLTTDTGKWLREFPLHFPEGRVGWLNLEMSETNLRRWMQHANVGGSRMAEPLNLRGTGFNPFADDWMEHVRQRIVRDDVRLLVVDSLTELVVGAGLDEHTEILPAIVQMDTLKNDTPLTNLLYLGHHGHSGERLRGDSRAEGRMDALIKMVVIPPPHGPRFLSATGRYDDGAGLDESELVTGPDGYVLQRGVNRKNVAEGMAAQAQEVLKAVRSTEARDALLAAVHEQPGVHTRDLRATVTERLGGSLSRARFKRAKEELLDEELIRVVVNKDAGNAHQHYPVEGSS